MGKSSLLPMLAIGTAFAAPFMFPSLAAGAGAGALAPAGNALASSAFGTTAGTLAAELGLPLAGMGPAGSLGMALAPTSLAGGLIGSAASGSPLGMLGNLGTKLDNPFLRMGVQALNQPTQTSTPSVPMAAPPRMTPTPTPQQPIGSLNPYDDATPQLEDAFGYTPSRF